MFRNTGLNRLVATAVAPVIVYLIVVPMLRDAPSLFAALGAWVPHNAYINTAIATAAFAYWLIRPPTFPSGTVWRDSFVVSYLFIGIITGLSAYIQLTSNPIVLTLLNPVLTIVWLSFLAVLIVGYAVWTLILRRV